MKIFIGADSPELTSKIAKRFGHANYYLIYDLENQNLEIIENKEHDEKHQILFDAIKNNARVFIVGNIGPHAFDILNSGNSKIYLARKMTVEQALQKMGLNELELLTEPTVKKSMHRH